MAKQTPRTLRIATRESQLAMWQANYLADRLREIAPDCEVVLVPVSTIGDRDRSEPLREMGGQGVFTREIQRVVLADQADMAVHSLKDLPTIPTPGLVLAGLPERAPRYDALIVANDSIVQNFEQLSTGAVIGTGSPRRQAQLLYARPDLKMAEIRGNVETRLNKLAAGEYDAIVLAEAGLRRLGLEGRIRCLLEPPVMLPAVGQAALGIECREDDARICELLQQISDPITQAEVTAERQCLRTLGAGCHAPVGVMCQAAETKLHFSGVVLSRDGRIRFDVKRTGELSNPEKLGRVAAEELIAQGAAALL